MSKPFALSEADFQEKVLNADKPVLVDFWADWCGPCMALAPVLDELAQELDGKLDIAKIDIDKNQAIAAQFGIRGIPTLHLFVNGKLVDSFFRAGSKTELLNFVSPHI